MPKINNVSFAGSRKDIDLEIAWFFAYLVIVDKNTTAESMVGSMNKGPNATIRLVRRQNHAGTTVSWTTVQREKSSHAYKLSSNVQTACSTDSLNNCPKHSILRFSSFALKIYL